MITDFLQEECSMLIYSLALRFFKLINLFIKKSKNKWPLVKKEPFQQN